MRLVFAMVIAMTALGGCASSDLDTGSIFYLKPYRLSEQSCEDLKKHADSAKDRLTNSEKLISKASTGAGGSIVNTLVYSPDWRKARWDYDVYRNEAARKNCPVETLEGSVRGN